MHSQAPKVVSPQLDLAEKIFAVIALLVFTEVLNFASYNNVSEGIPGFGYYVESVFDKIVGYMRTLIYVITFLLIIARLKSVVRPAFRDPFLWILVGIVVASHMWSDFPEVSQADGQTLLKTTLLGLYLASRFSFKELVQIMAWAFGLAVVISLLYTLAFRGAGIESGTHSGAWRGPLTHKNPFARLMVISVLPPLLAALDLHIRRYRYFVFAVSGLAVALIVLSTSKTALVICITLVVLLPLYSALRWSDGLAIPFFITMTLVGGSLATWGVSNWDNLLIGLGRDPTLSGRTYIWEAVIDQIWKRPWFGYGYQAFWKEKGEAEYVWRAVRFIVFQAHNGFINIGVELGLVGLSLFVLSLFFTYIRAIKWARLGKTSADLWPITYVTFLIMYNYSENTNLEPTSLYWVLYVAVTLSLKNLRVVNTWEEVESLGQRRLNRTSLESLP
jgi:exopolysaccharide production protein ExoQ